MTGKEEGSFDLDVIIVSWNTAGCLRGCLESLWRELCAANIHAQVLVVDNASEDGSQKMVCEDFPEVELIANTSNLGFAKANNQALERSSSPLVLLLNPDTVVLPGGIQSLAAYLDNHPQVGAVGPRVLNSDHSVQPSASPFPSLRREAWRLFHLDGLVAYSQYPQSYFESQLPQPADVLLGACILVRRQVLEQVGFFDEQFFVYSEEVDLCKRMRAAGWEIHWLPVSGLIHIGGASTQQVSDEMFFELYRNKIRLFRKYDGVIKSGAYKWVLWLASAVRLILSHLENGFRGTNKARNNTIQRRYSRLLKILPDL